MGHYCKICGKTQANEKFSGKGHKNHLCQDCSSKSTRKAQKNSIDENAFGYETTRLSEDMTIQSESPYCNDNWPCENDLEKHNIDGENEEELPF